MKLITAISEFLFGRRYYVNIINVRGTDICEMSSFIHTTRQAAERHRAQIESTASFSWIETVTFRSHKDYTSKQA